MRRIRPWRFLVKATCALVAVGALFIGIALLPGKLEGIYRQGPRCMCDSIHFSHYQDGRMVLYGTAHPPAEIFCRYETDADNVSTIHLLALKEGEADMPFMKAYPRLLVTRFVKIEDGSSCWDWKWPVSGETRKAIEEQAITSRKVKGDGSLVTTYHDQSLNPIRSETRLPRFPAKSVTAD